jgi:hypothetical protein
LNRLVRVRLGTFAAEALTDHRSVTTTAGNDNRATVEGVLKALRYYLKDKNASAPGWAYPDILRRHKPGDELELELEMDESLWRAFKSEAKQQEVTARQLLEHAVMYYVAALDEGQITRRILDKLETTDSA